MIDIKLLLVGVIIGIVIISTLQLVESYIPPTRAYDKITTSNGTVFAFNSSAKVNFVGTGSATVTGSNNSKTVYINVASTAGTLESLTNVTDSFCTTNQVRKAVGNQWVCANDDTGAGATDLEGLSDVDLTSPAYNHILQYSSALAQWINKLFTINTQTPANDIFVTGINNQTGVITTNQFSVNTITCSGTDKVSAINNVTGQVTCSTDASGGGTAREDLVADWITDATMTNIGTAYNTVYDIANSNNDGIRIDTNGMSTSTLQIHWTKIGTGTQKCQVRDVANAGVLIVFNNLVNGLNLNATQDIPTILENTIKTYLIECKSTTAADDPIWLHGQVLLR